jgi:hypothetical protein
MKAVHYNNRLVAFARGSQIRLDPDLAALRADHPDRRWALALAIYASKTETGGEGGRYSETRACAYARELMLPTAEFAPLAWLDNATLARWFAAPVEQVAVRRAELGSCRN